ncbi:MAG TPA: class I SAM-dependent methyltransferase [Stellaceae bacterium]|nr:class I SAM-dependent methyltransferase [Stellaceae bacterium]
MARPARDAAPKSSGDAPAPQAGPEFLGTCSLCGYVQIFKPAGVHSIRDEYPCSQCHASVRYRDQASVIIDEFGRGKALTIGQLVRMPGTARLDIYEAALHGPFVKHLSRLPGYVRSYFWSDLAPGAIRAGVRNEDLRSLTFPSASFDLVITSDVMEHIFDYRKAFEEIHRVLRPGGRHVFTIPTRWPLDPQTTALARDVGGNIVHLAAERYHVAGDGSKSLVVTDFGEDLLDELEEIGFHTSAVRRGMPLFPVHRVLTFVSRKRG